jgi:hypothetical protein
VLNGLVQNALTHPQHLQGVASEGLAWLHACARHPQLLGGMRTLHTRPDRTQRCHHAGAPRNDSWRTGSAAAAPSRFGPAEPSLDGSRGFGMGRGRGRGAGGGGGGLIGGIGAAERGGATAGSFRSFGAGGGVGGRMRWGPSSASSRYTTDQLARLYKRMLYSGRWVGMGVGETCVCVDAWWWWGGGRVGRGAGFLLIQNARNAPPTCARAPPCPSPPNQAAPACGCGARRPAAVPGRL